MKDLAAAAFLADGIWLAIVRALKLSQREAQIVRLLLSDETEGTMASILTISPHTVHTHLERLYRKLDVKSRSQVVIRIFQKYVEIAGPPQRVGTKGPIEA